MATKDVAKSPQSQLDLFEQLPGQVEVLEEDMGELVDWTETPIFLGQFTGTTRSVVIPENQTPGEPEKASILYGFLDPVSGDKRSLWGPFQIVQAMSDVAAGDFVLFQWQGKRPGKGVRQINVFDIRVKRSVLS